MIQKEFYKQRKDGVNLYRTFSSAGLKIKKVSTGEIYDEAIDVESSNFIYVETNQPVDQSTDQTNILTI